MQHLLTLAALTLALLVSCGRLQPQSAAQTPSTVPAPAASQDRDFRFGPDGDATPEQCEWNDGEPAAPSQTIHWGRLYSC